jgi:SpoVK/Ycf46/Vps4 family AAA+-type ATPase
VNDFITKRPAAPGGSNPPATIAQNAGGGQTAAGAKSEPEAEQAPSLDELLAELDELCGLDKVKADVKSLINLVKVRALREENGLPVPPMSLHLVFMGNPGTGKTTVARLLSKIYHAIGVLSKGQLVEVDRSGLVAGFVGQTALKTGEVIQKSLGGVLFIDEAYALANQESANDFGREAIEVLLKGMEDNRKDLIVIVAGYTALMGKFISSNPGLESRFNKYFYFEDYTGEQLMTIFTSMCKKNGYTMDEETRQYAAKAFQTLYDERDENFGNARDVRNVFERAVARQANRVAAMEHPGRESLMAFTIADLQED